MRYASNTVCGTCHNYRVILNKGQTRTFRARLLPVRAGALLWKLSYTNAVFSTFADGAEARADMPGGRFRVLDCELNGAPVRWSSDVFEPGGAYESAVFCAFAAEGIPFTFTWRLCALEDNCILPCTPDSRAECYSSSDGAHFESDDLCVLPDSFEALTDAKAQMCFMGDSITQGCGTRAGCFEQWAARIALGIEKEVAVRNLGLGYGRAQDAARQGYWLKAAAGSDIVNLCFGVNDLLHGTQSASALTDDIKRIIEGLRRLNPGVRIVLFTIPPFNLEPAREANRIFVQEKILKNDFCADAIFDISAVLAAGSDRSQAFFGAHPDGRGGAAVAGEYLSRFWPIHRRHLLSKQG